MRFVNLKGAPGWWGERRGRSWVRGEGVRFVDEEGFETRDGVGADDGAGALGLGDAACAWMGGMISLHGC